MRRTIVLDLTGDANLGKDLVATGGVFAAGASIRLDEECNLVLRAGAEELRLVARAVLVNDRGAGLEIVGRTSQVRDQIEAFVRIASYLAVMRDEQATPGRASRQDTIPTMPPTPEPAGPPRNKGEIIERVRTVRYQQDEDQRDSLQGRTKTLAGTLSESSRRRPASSAAPTERDVRRVAAGSIAPESEPTDQPPQVPAAPRVAIGAIPTGKRRAESHPPIALAPTQDADSLESKALAAQVAAQSESESESEDDEA